MILLIDNYDSFVHNLSRYFVELGQESRIVRNDAISLNEIKELSPTAIVISPGPCTPNEAGISLEVVKQFASSIPLLGVCLGHQVIAAAFGANILRAQLPVHGQTAFVHHTGQQLFAGLPQPLCATRYHSLVVDEETLPDNLQVTARLDDDTVMAIEHLEFSIVGVQFHPESVLTASGHQLLANFLKNCGIVSSEIPTGDFIEPSTIPSWTKDDWPTGQKLFW